MSRRSVLLIQPSLQPPGGGNGVAAWMLQALADVHRVTVLTWTPVDVESINRFFGTTLTRSSFDAIALPLRNHGARPGDRRAIGSRDDCLRNPRQLLLYHARQQHVLE